jgi:hypothetical protein
MKRIALRSKMDVILLHNVDESEEHYESIEREATWTYHMIPLVDNVQNRHIHRDMKCISGCQGLGICILGVNVSWMLGLYLG